MDSKIETHSVEYTTFVATTIDQLWHALLHPGMTTLWWHTTLQSDWNIGSTVIWSRHGMLISDPDQVVLDCQPFTHLSYTWQSYPLEFVAVMDLGDAFFEAVRNEPRSFVSYTLTAVDDGIVKLSFKHAGFVPNSPILERVRDRWPRNLSSLKTLLETGRPLPG